MNQRGFTLLEVVIAIAILAVSLGALLEAQVSSLANAARSRDLTVATMLARSKVIDVEQKIYEEGFTRGEVTMDGDFQEEGHEDIKWSAKVSEIEIDLSSLASMCGAAAGSDDSDSSAAANCESSMASVTGILPGVPEEIANNLRTAEIKIIWPAGKYTESMTIRTLLLRENPNQFLPTSPASSNPTGSNPPLQPGNLPFGQPLTQ
jgi:general secretion pathway protein I